MAVTIEVRQRGPDGKVRLVHMRSEAERWRLIKLAHQSRCELGLSYRGVQERLEQYGAHVSVGQIFTYLARWECDSCAAPPAQEPPEQPAEPARTLRSAVSGLLTGQITDG